MPVPGPRFDDTSRVRVCPGSDASSHLHAFPRLDPPTTDRTVLCARRLDLRVLLACFLAFALASCAGSPASDEPGPGRLIIIGGGLQADNEAVYRSILESRVAPPVGGPGVEMENALSVETDGASGVGTDASGTTQGASDAANGGTGRVADPGPICVIPTASGVPESSSASAVRTFARYGGPGSVVGLEITTENPAAASDPDMVAALLRCGGFYFTGGQQGRIVEVFRPGGIESPASEAVLERFRAGAPISGSSAGAAIMSDPMINGGSSAGALLHGIRRPAEEASEEAQGGVILQQGMGYFPNALVDQHFLARGRIGRLIIAVLEGDEFGLGFGIDENTALVVDDGVARVVGASGVVVVDGRGARRSSDGIGGTDMRLTLLGPGDTFDLRSFEAHPTEPAMANAAPYVRQAADGGVGTGTEAGAGAGADGARDSGAAAAADPFARWTFLHLLAELATGPAAEAEWAAGEHRIVLRKDAGFVARLRGTGAAEGEAEGEGDGEAGPVTLFAGPFILDLVEAR